MIFLIFIQLAHEYIFFKCKTEYFFKVNDKLFFFYFTYVLIYVLQDILEKLKTHFMGFSKLYFVTYWHKSSVVLPLIDREKQNISA